MPYTPEQHRIIKSKLQTLADCIAHDSHNAPAKIIGENNIGIITIQYTQNNDDSRKMFLIIQSLNIGAAWIPHNNTTAIQYGDDKNIPVELRIKRIEEATEKLKTPAQVQQLMRLARNYVDGSQIQELKGKVTDNYPTYMLRLTEATERDVNIISILEESLQGNVAGIKRTASNEITFTLAAKDPVKKLEQAIRYIHDETALKENPWTERVAPPKPEVRIYQSDEDFTQERLKAIFGAESIITFQPARGKEPAYIAIKPSEPEDIVEHEGRDHLMSIIGEQNAPTTHQYRNKGESEDRLELRITLSAQTFRRQVHAYELVQRDFSNRSPREDISR